MRKTNKSNGIIERQYILALGICAISVSVLAFFYGSSQGKEEADEFIVDLTEIEDEAETETEVTTNHAKAENFVNEDIFGWDNVMDATDEVKENPEPMIEVNTKEEEDEIVKEEDTAIETIQKPVILSFTESDKLLWPVNGNVIMNYSMDKSIYFSTLKQYRYNPALIIASEEGTQVLAAAKGQIVHIGEQEDIGMTVTMDLGNEYKLLYGQLQDVCVHAGEVVEAGQVIGSVSIPSKCYVTEGSNLYMKLTRNGQPVNPMEYLK